MNPDIPSILPSALEVCAVGPECPSGASSRKPCGIPLGVLMYSLGETVPICTGSEKSLSVAAAPLKPIGVPPGL